MKNDFDKVYIYYDNFMKFFDLYKEKEILQLLNLKGNEVIADLGGGTGYLAKHLLPYCKEVYVIDESQMMLSKINDDRIKVLCSDITNTNLESNYFDIVILTDVLHHIKEKDKLFIEINRILKKDGWILIYDFEINNFKTKLLKIFEQILFNNNLYFFTKNQIEQLLLKYNFKEMDKIVKDFYFIILWEKK
ncbi:MAG TPA: class I SAM-dependent methyltransferase [Spirochaetota bacterium]|nr:class I SAM-dependent methyltransferase [Spirochaetota bacterium]HOL57196.1 class I SAM-dependent methyltransferase [Spirochaetota bacterium]HPP04791.1 class I SAM-dependent methyltransferase [Spirochaetota bacterium]